MQVAPSCSALRVRLIVRYGISRCLENTEPSASANNQTHPRISLHNGRALRGAPHQPAVPARALDSSDPRSATTCLAPRTAALFSTTHSRALLPAHVAIFHARVYATGDVIRSSSASFSFKDRTAWSARVGSRNTRRERAAPSCCSCRATS